MFKKAIAVKVSGSYQLEKYDDNLEKWLDSMNLNGAVFGKIFRQTKVKVSVQEPTKYAKKWSVSHKDGGDLSFKTHFTCESSKAVRKSG